MTRILFFFLYFISISKNSNAQITMADETAEWVKIGEVKPLGSTKAKMEYHATGTDTVYFLLMKDFSRKENESTHYFSVKFRSTGNTFGTLYELLKSFFLDENKKNKNYSKTFKLGDEMVNLQYRSMIGGKGVMFYTNDGYINFTEKDIDKLFGKR